MLKVRVKYLEKMDHDVEYNEYLFENMKNVATTSTCNTTTNNNNNKKKRWSKHRGIGGKRRGLNLRVKLKRLWVRATIAHWLNLSLRRAFKSILFSIGSRTTKRSRNKTTTTTSGRSSASHFNHYQCSYVRSNSFYAEAIADCLEFIKRSSSNHHHHHHDQHESHKLLL